MEDKSAELILFEAIQTRLSSLITSKVIHSVESENAQFDNEDAERARAYPFLTVEINTDWQGSEARNSIDNIYQVGQKGQATVTTRLVYDSLRTETESYKLYKPICHVIYRLLNGLSDANSFTPLDRISSLHSEPHDKVSQIVVTYSTLLSEFSITNDDLTEIESGNWVIEYLDTLDIDNDVIRTGDGE